VVARKHLLLGGALVAALAAIAGTGVVASGRPAQEVAAPTRPGWTASHALATAEPALDSSGDKRDRLDVPRYGYDPDNAFVRQRHDYPPDTPERLGPDVGRVLFDLETVIDTVASGADEAGRIHDARHSPLSPAPSKVRSRWRSRPGC
jgi:hypothetical protein